MLSLRSTLLDGDAAVSSLAGPHVCEGWMYRCSPTRSLETCVTPTPRLTDPPSAAIYSHSGCADLMKAGHEFQDEANRIWLEISFVYLTSSMSFV